VKPTSAGLIKVPQGLWTGLTHIGIAPDDVARRAGLPLSVVTHAAVGVDQYYAIWQAYSELIGDPATGIVRLATAFETPQYPPPVLATYHARDYRDALRRMTRYKELCPPERLRIAEKGDTCRIELDEHDPSRPCPPLLVGITLAFLLELGRRGTGLPITAQLVEFTQPMGDIHVLEAYFGCRIRTGASVNRLTLRRSELDRSFVSHNEEMLELLTPVLDHSIEERQRDRSTADEVKQMLKRKLGGGVVDVPVIAKELGMSDRTLQRRLADEKTSFKRLLTQARREQARTYLENPSMEMKEVAFLLGYEDQSSFYRAFRLWEGQTPSNWRKEKLSCMS